MVVESTIVLWVGAVEGRFNDVSKVINTMSIIDIDV